MPKRSHTDFLQAQEARLVPGEWNDEPNDRVRAAVKQAVIREGEVAVDFPTRYALWYDQAQPLTPEGVRLVNATLEMCALMADEYSAWPAREMAARIRAKKQ